VDQALGLVGVGIQSGAANRRGLAAAAAAVRPPAFYRVAGWVRGVSSQASFVAKLNWRGNSGSGLPLSL